MGKVFYWILQLTWGLPQTILGLVVFLINAKKKHYLFRFAVATEWEHSSGVSLGLFIFVPQNSGQKNGKNMLFHEYGHTIQSLILGPAYLLIIGIPSIIWFHIFRKKECKSCYTDFYTEKWAENEGKTRRIKEERYNIPMTK